MRTLLFILLSNICLAQPTFFGEASSPADNGTNLAAAVTVTPPASMVVGDLVFMVHQSGGTAVTHSITTTGGQNWALLGDLSQANSSLAYYWCRFDGTWTADPVSTASTGVVPNSVYMAVFRPTASTKTWGVDILFSSATYAAPSTPFSVTITGVTTTKANAVVIGVFSSTDDNTWTESAGTWTEVTAQYRNTSSTGMSAVVVYQIKGTTGGTGDATWDQATNGGDAGRVAKVVFYEYTPTNRGFLPGF